MTRNLASALVLPLLLVAWVAVPQQDVPAGDWVLDLVQGGKPLLLELPDFETKDPRLAEEAAEISRVLRADLEFASIYRMVAKGTGADLRVTGTLAREDGKLVSLVRVHAIAEARVVFTNEYRTTDPARRLAHHIADEIVGKSGVEGIARTQIAFASEREGKRVIYRMDYDGSGPEALAEGFLSLAPRWAPDGRSILYVSFPTRISSPVLALLTGGRGREVLMESESMVFPGSWSPDGEKVAFSSTRDGNAEIYVVNRDGTGLKRLTDHPGIDVSPTWSPTGREIAFTSNRTGSPQIYTIDPDGLNLTRISREGSYNAEPAWSPSSEFSEIAYASRIEGGVFDVVVHDLLTHQVRQLTARRGLNESPSWAPNGRHIVFSSTRTGEPRLFTVNRDASNLRQIPFEAKGTTPNWGPVPR